MEKDISELKVHESIIVQTIISSGIISSRFLVTRVNGGFIYENTATKTAVFVPDHN